MYLTRTLPPLRRVLRRWGCTRRDRSPTSHPAKAWSYSSSPVSGSRTPYGTSSRAGRRRCRCSARWPASGGSCGARAGAGLAEARVGRRCRRCSAASGSTRPSARSPGALSAGEAELPVEFNRQLILDEATHATLHHRGAVQPDRPDQLRDVETVHRLEAGKQPGAAGSVSVSVERVVAHQKGQGLGVGREVPVCAGGTVSAPLERVVGNCPCCALRMPLPLRAVRATPSGIRGPCPRPARRPSPASPSASASRGAGCGLSGQSGRSRPACSRAGSARRCPPGSCPPR